MFSAFGFLGSAVMNPALFHFVAVGVFNCEKVLDAAVKSSETDAEKGRKKVEIHRDSVVSL